MPRGQKNKLPKISIITPSFNQAKFLEQTIQSVISQNYPNLEYLIMDGGSKDGSVEIIKKYANKYTNLIKWQSKPDGGQVFAINEGIKKSTGEIIAYINSDDYYLPGSFEKVIYHFNNNPKSLWVVGDCQPSFKKLGWTFFLKQIWPIELLKSASYIFNTINQPSVFLKKELIDKVGDFSNEFPYSFDHEYWLRCLEFKLPTRIRENLSVFRIQPNSISNQMYKEQLDQDYQIVKRFSNNNWFLLALHRLGQKLIVYSYKKLK